MSNTIQASTGVEAPKTAGRPLNDLGTRLAGVGALTFVGTVILQNVVRGASAPSNGASAEKVLTHYADHAGITSALVAMFALSGVGLAVFLGGAARQMLAGSRRGWALTGIAGAIGILTIFSVLVGTEQALSVVASHDHPSVGAIEALWALHNSVFTVLFLSISVALLGLSRAGVAAGVTPGAFERLGVVGSALLLVGVVSGPSIAAGNTMALFGVSALGFLIWLAFLAITGTRLLRGRTS